jgi:Cytochrome c oxidase subunit IV
MSPIFRVCAGLGIFLGVAAIVYWFTSYEPSGSILLGIAAITFGFLALILRSASRREPEEQAEEELQIGPTIWPLGFALSGAVIAIGVIESQWVVIVGAVGFAVCAWGWLRAVTRSHAGAHD